MVHKENAKSLFEEKEVTTNKPVILMKPMRKEKPVELYGEANVHCSIGGK